MLRLVVRRAWVQRRPLSVVVLLIAVATALMGFGSQLLEVTGPKAFSEQVQRSQPDEVDVTAYAVDLAASDLASTSRESRAVVQQVLAPLHPSLVSTATSRMRRLEGSDRLGYLATTDAIAGQASLTSGRWPADATSGPIEAVAPDTAARLLHLHLGDRVTLGSETGLGGSSRPVTVVVVGTFRASSRAAWQSDPLSGAGFDPAYSDGSVTAPSYGPFMVGGAAFLRTGSSVNGLRVDAQPDLRTADDASLRSAVASLDSASGLLAARVGSSARITRVASELPDTLDRLHTQQATTRSAVLVALLLGTALSLAALLLAGRLVAATRTDERELLTTMGLGRGQQLVSALVEAALLAVVAAVLAVPAAAVAHSVATHLSDLSAAGLSQSPTITVGLVVTALAGAVLLTLVLVLSPLVEWETGRLSGRRRVLARSSVDVLLLAVAGISWWQLHSRPAAAGGGDVTLMVAPVVCLVAVTVVAVRCLPPLLGLAAAAGSRSRALLPLSLHPAALRLSDGTALVLLATASAAAVFGVALHTTWQRSQADQADLRVGTGLSLALSSPPTADDAAAIDRAVRDTTTAARVSPVTSRPVALGSYTGSSGDPPELVALDSRHAGVLLRGRLPTGTTWSAVGRRLTPKPVRGVPLPTGGAGVEAVAHAPAGVALSVTPSVVVQDATGFRSTLNAASFPADGRTHPLQWSAPPPAGQRIVAVQLGFADEGSADTGEGSLADVTVRLRVPGHGVVASWQVQSLGRESPARQESIVVRRAAGATVLATDVQLDLSYLLYEDGEVLGTAFDPPRAVPVAVSQQLVDAIGTKIGGELSATIDDTALVLRVVQIVPTVPSAPARVAVLADVDTLSRALIGAGRLDPAVDAFWVSHPTARTARALDALTLGEVTTRTVVAADLARGPMQVTVPVAYVTLVVSAVLLLLAGAALVVSADQRRQSAEVARLRALGLTRRRARRFLLAEHSALLVPLVLVGALVGGAVSLALDASLIRSDEGTAPVPRVLLVWPWVTEALLTGGLVLGCLLVAVVAAALQVRRSDATQLRAGG